MTALRKNSDGRQMNPPRLNVEQNYRRMVKKKETFGHRASFPS